MPCMVKIIPQAQAEFEDLAPSVQARILKVFARLEKWPQVSGVEKLTGEWAGKCKIRTGDYRVVFHPVGNDVVIVRIGHRRDVYE